MREKVLNRVASSPRNAGGDSYRLSAKTSSAGVVAKLEAWVDPLERVAIVSTVTAVPASVTEVNSVRALIVLADRRGAMLICGRRGGEATLAPVTRGGR